MKFAMILTGLALAQGCATAGSRSPAFAKKPVSGAPDYQNPDLPVETRVHDLVSRMTSDEKVLQLINSAAAIDRLGIPHYDYWNEALHGDAGPGISTVFPEPIGMAASFDPDLVHQVATAISDEGRAKYYDFHKKNQSDVGQGLNFWTPNINIFRDPRWGRGQETYGEDPFLTSKMGVQFIQGMQGDDPHYFKTIATPKHFAVHSGPEATREEFNSVVGPKDLEETYLPAFKAAIQDGGAFSIMTSYNEINGVPASANPWLMGTTLREGWGFKGFVVSDCDAVEDIYDHFNVVDTPEEASAMALKAGLDLNCGTTFGSLGTALAKHLITEDDLTTAAERVFSARFRLGLFDPDERVPYSKIPFSVVDSLEHRALALHAARESIVLLKNANNALPLVREKIHSIAVIGSRANDSDELLGNYNGKPSKVVTVLQGIQDHATHGTKIVYQNGTGLPEAVQAAQGSDLAILVLGLSQDIEAEEKDRDRIELPDDQLKLLQAVRATGTPTVLVLLNGGPVSIPWADQNIDAIVDAWYPGEKGGHAVADVLFGDYNPAGRLPVTVYRSTDDLPALENYSMQGRTYRFFKGLPLYRFGFGLSYSQFKYSGLTQGENDSQVFFSVDVTNTSGRDGEEVTEVYVSQDGASPTSPVRSLEGFKRIALKAGEKKTLRFALSPSQFSSVDDDGKRSVKPGTYTVSVGGKQPDGGADVLSFTVQR